MERTSRICYMYNEHQGRSRRALALPFSRAFDRDGSLPSSGTSHMPLTATQLEQQKKQAEELLFSGPQSLGFAKSLFFGRFNAAQIFPYPQLKPEEREEVAKAVGEVRRFA